MLKHIVLFSLKDFPNEAARSAQLARIKEELEALPALIPALHSLSVYYNENPAEAYDFALEAVVDDLGRLSEYAEHPEHIRVAKEHIKPYVASRACVDFTI